MRDYDSSSNDEEIEYCTRQPRPRTVFNKRSHNVVLHPVDKSSTNDLTAKAAKKMDMITSQKDTLNSRSSDGSLDGLTKKARKSKLKARIEAKRDRICADSSSDEDPSRKCNNNNNNNNSSSSSSVTRYYQSEIVQGAAVAQKNGYCNRKSRAARTERYMKRLSRDETPKFSENLTDIANKRTSLDFMNEHEEQLIGAGVNELFCPAVSQQQQSLSRYSNSNTFPVPRSTAAAAAAENLRQTGGGMATVVSNYQARSSNDLAKGSSKYYITDMNRNNKVYAKPKILHKARNFKQKEENSTNYDAINRSLLPPEPPPRDPRCRLLAYGCNSFPFNGEYRASRYDEDTLRTKMNDIHQVTKDHVKSLRLHDPSTNNDNNGWSGFTKINYPRRPLSLTISSSTESCNLSECTNNRHNSTGKHVDVERSTFTETEAMKCRRRNDRNDQLTSRFKNYDTKIRENKFTYINVRNNCASPAAKSVADTPSTRLPIKNSCDSSNTSSLPVIRKVLEGRSEVDEQQQEALERRRSSKNLEEALSELEAIYNSLRLGDEDLLDRAERRSMEEFSLRQLKSLTPSSYTEDLTDRTKDDMAYRRMHPKERPASLSEVVGQSALSDISYLIASPIETRKNPIDDYHPYTNTYSGTRKDEPDVTRDDVVYRSIHRANNMLKVIDPQPPFGIPLGPVTTATESDYLHTTPKLEHPRSPYIPQREPDIVTDDMAYRTLRKDSGVQSKIDAVPAAANTHGENIGTKKKAVRSLSANLYGLIDHDRIHLRKESSLRDTMDEINAITDVETLSVRTTDRRVVSDGELSDYDTRWRSDFFRSKIDINGNDRTIPNGHRQKLRVYVSPLTRVHSFNDDHNRKIKTRNSLNSTDNLRKPVEALSNEFCLRDTCMQQDESNQNEETPDENLTEPDFMAYSRLCQDLVNLIEGQNDVEAKMDHQTTTNDKEDDPILSSNNQADESQKCDVKEEFRTESVVPNLKKHDKEKAEGDDSFDFYLRVADENVKLIAEAFSSVADHLRDSRSSQKNSLTSGRRRHRSQIDTETTTTMTTVPLNTNDSTRSSTIRDDLDDDNDDDPSNSSKTPVTTDDNTSNVVPTEDTMIITLNLEDQVESRKIKTADSSIIDPGVELTKAVHDLQLATASLCEHEKEIEQLVEVLLRQDVAGIRDASAEDVSAFAITETDTALSSSLDDEDNQKEYDQEETVVSIGVKSSLNDPNCEGEDNRECKQDNTCEPNEIPCSTEMRVSYVTNLVTILVTAYSMVFLACFVALLLATIAAS